MKALRDKLGLSVKDREDTNEVIEPDAEDFAEDTKKPTKSEKKEPAKPIKESKPAPDPSSVEVPKEIEEPKEPIKKPINDENENYDLVYAWRYSEGNRYAKIGISTKKGLPNRMPGTYHPTYTPILIGIYKCDNRQHAEAVESELLSKLKRTRPDREWVEIDEAFNEMIEKSFSDMA